MEPLKIYLCDLTHDSVVLVTDTIPINIGFLGSYAKMKYGDDIKVSLFKYPQSAVDAIKSDPPDVLGLSNYCWNSHLSERVAQLAKEVNPAVITVQGGTNFPFDTPSQRDFLVRRPSTDVHVDLEGEISFSNLIGRVLESRDGGQKTFDSPIDGCVFIEPSTRFDQEPMAIRGNRPERIRNLDDIPSPYLNGMLDHFFDGNLTPFLETNRGCPFSCSFCNTGDSYFQKSNMFSIDRIREEIAYIAPKIVAAGTVNLHIADTNFGMFPRDREICEALKLAHDNHGWPRQIMSTTGKNNKERVIDITNIMGTIFSVNMSVQSMDKNVLSNIRRQNIQLDDFIRINQHLQDSGRTTKGELIMGMPGESKESFLKGVEQMIDAKVSFVCIYTLMLLTGTEFKNPQYLKEHGIKGKYRVVPLNFGEYEGSKILDCEEVGIESNDMSFDDYLYLRGFALLTETLHNGRPFEELFRYALALGVGRMELLRRLNDNITRAPQEVQDLVKMFLDETRDELWNSEEELIAHYQNEEQYGRLLRGEVGGNLIYKYKTLGIGLTVGSWITYITDTLHEVIGEKLGATDQPLANEQIRLLAEFCQSKLAGLLAPDSNLGSRFLNSKYDIAGWLQDDEGVSINDYSRDDSIDYEFYYTDDQMAARARMFKRYGTEPNAISKIITRIPSLESWTRMVRTAEGDYEIYSDAQGDQFIRYTLAR